MPKDDAFLANMRSGLLCWMLIVLMGVVVLWPAASASADVGPKPQMRFSFEYHIEPVPIVAGKLIECDDAACAAGTPLREVGPQRFVCSSGECSSMAYGYAPYHKLVIKFADRTRESNVFEKQGYSASFRGTVSESDLVVEEAGPGRSPLWPVVATLVVETLVAALYLRFFRLPARVLVSVIVANIISLPVVWLVFPQLTLPAALIIALSASFAWLFETGFVYVLNRRRLLLKHALALSLLMNAASFVIGLFVV